ncbi:cupin domain-containing protein [Halogeometricum sp. S1BR25-6]|uniref:Cupin domain-containing protein n=1 Tax=Halogeometricum salsisoli TaxID=2950536 RepID=A0ABU2GDL2_9EURY|nr:cupin domain-containing protein [Halogeometricum sp. S1BR25-6]MDS0298906.1 cupin domain-containing protein [Halogeometricum sp. S1BR25-6]
MSHTKANYRDGGEKADGMFFLREELDAENLGFTVVEADPDWTGMEHDHADEDHEEVYYLVEGGATLHVDGESVDLEPGDAVRVSPDASRQLENGSEESRLVVAGAP